MGKRICMLLTLLCMAAAVFSARADVVIFDPFYYQNSDGVERVARGFDGYKQFIIDSPNGFILARKHPALKEGTETSFTHYGRGGYDDDFPAKLTKSGEFYFDNGDIIYIDGIYIYNGEYWATLMPSHTYQPVGWVCMDDLLMCYNREDFIKNNEDMFYPYEGDFDLILSATRLVEWQWPGSDKEKRVIEKNIDKFANVHYAYMDEDGREWGYTTYSRGWICLSDPSNMSIPSFYPAPAPIKWSPDGVYDWSAGGEVYEPPHKTPEAPPGDTLPPDDTDAKPDALLIIVICVVIAAGAATAVVVIRKAGRKNKNGD